VRVLQFVHGRLSSVTTPRVLHHAPFPGGGAVVVEPWNWVPHGVWYFFMGLLGIFHWI
jgi:hypothetical protein